MKTIVAGILGALKLVLDAFGITVLDENAINAIANGVAAIALVVAILRDNITRWKKKKAEKAKAAV